MMLNPQATALACGIIWSAGVLLISLAALTFNYGTDIVDLIGTVYVGYKPTVLGSFIGAIWGFFDAAFGGLIFAWLYNKLNR